MRRWVRTVFAFAIALSAWMVAMPARAATLSTPDGGFAGPAQRAPMCDDRAATMFAPAPQLQAPQTSLDTGDAGDECISHFLDDGVAHQGDHTPRGAPTAPDAALTVTIPAVSPAPITGTSVPAAASFALPRGVHSRLDRPPRG